MLSPVPTDDMADLRNGISAYWREQRVLLRLLRKRGQFTAHEFDKWFRNREWWRPRKLGPPIKGDTILLGLGTNGFNRWAEMLELLQAMMALGLVTTTSQNGVVVYALPKTPSSPSGRPSC